MSIKDITAQLDDLTKSFGSLPKLISDLKNKAINESDLSDEDKAKTRSILNSMDFEALANKNASKEDIERIIKSKM